jgi:glycerate 2-kinase
VHVLVCPTGFKGTLTAAAAAAAMDGGVRSALPGATTRVLPLSDGGPGLLDAIGAVIGGERRSFRTTGPLGGPVGAETLWTAPDEVVIEAAEACGLHLVPGPARDPAGADTRGVGTLLLACADRGARRAFVGLGGSATVDGGCGLAGALGWRFLDAGGNDLPPGGAPLERLARVVPASPPSLGVTALADVRSPLLGPDGAARRFGPQKGATPALVEALERGLARLADRVARDAGRDPRDLPGAGAAGGLGYGLVAFAGAELADGSDWVLERTGFDGELDGADLVVTGEGAWDPTSGLGKITARVLERARDAGVPALLACGRIEGAAPAEVHAADGGGARLDAGGLARLVEEALRTAGAG